MLKHFNYWLVEFGWAEVFFVSSEQAIRFEFSYHSDPLTSLIESLLSLLSSSVGEANVDFFNEPGLNRLTITKLDNETVIIRIRTWSDIEAVPDIPKNWESTRPVFEVADNFNNVCSVVLSGVLDLRNRHTDSEYLEQWLNYPFPGAQLQLLKQTLSE